MRPLNRRLVLALALVLALGIVAALSVLAWRFVTSRDTYVLRTQLRLGSLPRTLDNIRCTQATGPGGHTDCYFSFTAADFDRLLKGWSFREITHDVAARGLGPGSAGTRFPVARIYQADVSREAGFQRGGHVLLYVSGDGTRARLSVQVD